MTLEKHMFLDKLESLKSKMKCPFSDCEDWILCIEEPVDINNQIITEFVIKNSDGTSGIPAISMCCNNCGFLRLHSVQKLT